MHRNFLVPGFFAIVLGACTITPEGEVGTAPVWTFADEINVTETAFVTTQTFFLIDASRSNKMLGQVKEEVAARIAELESTQSACVIQINDDSLASSTRMLCLKPAAPYMCYHPDVKLAPYDTKREETAYGDAQKRVDEQMAECTPKLEEATAKQREENKTELDKFLAGITYTNYTDITGALARAQQLVQDGALEPSLWIYSDMVEDLKEERAAPLTVDLTKFKKVHVREILLKGSQAGIRQPEWTEKLTNMSLDPSKIDWSNFWQDEVKSGNVHEEPPAEKEPAVTPTKKEEAVKKTAPPVPAKKGSPKPPPGLF